MEKEKLENLLIDYIDGKLTEPERHLVDQELMRNEEAYKLNEQLKVVMHAMQTSAGIEPSSKVKQLYAGKCNRQWTPNSCWKLQQDLQTKARQIAKASRTRCMLCCSQINIQGSSDLQDLPFMCKEFYSL